MSHLDIAERRRRLGVRHALAAPAATAEDVVAAQVALHSTDPAAMVLAAMARLQDPSIAEIERALYTDRTLTRILTMRRTVFAVPSDAVPTFLAATRRSVAEPERRKLVKFIGASGIAEPDRWLAEAHAAAIESIAGLGEFSSAELGATHPLLATRIEIGAGTKFATSQSVGSRLLTLLSAEGHVVRVRPAGSWASTQFRWSAIGTWLPDLPEAPSADEARTEVARRWLSRFGPARPEDLQWWTGWTKGETTSALAALDLLAVTTDDGPAIVLADDGGLTPEPDPWVALLPALDPTTMGWKARDWFLGPHAEQLFDTNGNAGPTIWSNGEIIGGWAIRGDGTVVVRVLADRGADAARAIEQKVDQLQQLLGGAVVKARARGWTPLERDLRDTPVS